LPFSWLDPSFVYWTEKTGKTPRIYPPVMAGASSKEDESNRGLRNKEISTMSKSSEASKAVSQSGYHAIRKSGKADVAGWCPPGGTHSGNRDASGPAGDGPIAVFGPDDIFVADFDQKTLSVFDFDALGDGSEALIRTKLDVTIVKAHSSGGATPLLLYAIDEKGQAWSTDAPALHRRSAHLISTLTLPPWIRRSTTFYWDAIRESCGLS
jgi:hypothetical protein